MRPDVSLFGGLRRLLLVAVFALGIRGMEQPIPAYAGMLPDREGAGQEAQPSTPEPTLVLPATTAPAPGTPTGDVVTEPQEAQSVQDAPEDLTVDRLQSIDELGSFRTSMYITWVNERGETAEILARNRTAVARIPGQRSALRFLCIETQVGNRQKSYQIIETAGITWGTDGGEWVRLVASPVDIVLEGELGSSVDVWLEVMNELDLLRDDWRLRLDTLLGSAAGVFLGPDVVRDVPTWRYRFTALLPQVEALGEFVTEDGDVIEELAEDQPEQIREGLAGRTPEPLSDDGQVELGEEETLGQEPLGTDEVVVDVWVVPEFSLPVRVEISGMGGDADDDIGPLTIVFTLSQVNEPIDVQLPCYQNGES